MFNAANAFFGLVKSCEIQFWGWLSHPEPFFATQNPHVY
jgi:hypothetical protein